MQASPTVKELRQFGILVGGVVAGIWLYNWQLKDRAWFLLAGLGLFLILTGILVPHILRYPYRAWMKLGELIGSVVNRIVLTLIFLGVVTPISIIRRLLGGDPLGKQFNHRESSYFSIKEIQSPSTLKQLF